MFKPNLHLSFSKVVWDTLLVLWIVRLASKFYSSGWHVLHLGVRFKFGNAWQRPAGLTIYIHCTLREWTRTEQVHLTYSIMPIPGFRTIMTHWVTSDKWFRQNFIISMLLLITIAPTANFFKVPHGDTSLLCFLQLFQIEKMCHMFLSWRCNIFLILKEQ